MCLQIKLDPDQGASKWLYISFQLKARELMYLIQNGFAHFWKVDDLSNLLCVHVVKVLPLELGFLFNLACNVIEVHHLCELSEGSHRAPEPLFDHLAYTQHYLT